MRRLVTLSTIAFLSTAAFANSDMQKQIDSLTKEVQELKKQQQSTTKTLTEVKVNTAGDNVKFGVDFRNAIDVLEYKNNETDETFRNHSLLTSRLYLNMAAAPMKGLTFKGKLAIYSTWGSKIYVQDAPLKDWSASSKAADTVMRLKEGYFVYSNSIGEQPVTFSVGRRPSSSGFLANMRENESEEGSPLAHITNMEVNGAMVKLDFTRYIPGSYVKLVYGRAHTGEMENVYGTTSGENVIPFADKDTAAEDENVDFFVMPGDAYNDGQYQVAYQWAHIFDTKGRNLATNQTAAASGVADMFALSLKVNGIGDGINDFLDDTVAFVSVASTHYDAKDGYRLISSSDGGTSNGQSIWGGFYIPDMITESGKFGLEYNHGSKNWTPMTWAEDTAIGSKIAVRGDAYEAYWNFDLFGVKYLPSQIRYTYVQHDYTPNFNCNGWTTPEKVDITAQDLRFFITYKY